MLDVQRDGGFDSSPPFLIGDASMLGWSEKRRERLVAASAHDDEAGAAGTKDHICRMLMADLMTWTLCTSRQQSPGQCCNTSGVCFELGLTYSDPGQECLNILQGWVDSDYASKLDTRKSGTGCVLSLNNAPVSWKVKLQD